MPVIKEKMIRISSLEEISGFSDIVLTGGEPILVPHRIHEAIDYFERQPEVKNIFLYTAEYIPKRKEEMREILSRITGITYTLHSSDDEYSDVYKFEQFQDLLYEDGWGKSISCRLAIDPNIRESIPLHPSVWSEVRIKTWKTGEQVCLPEHEELFTWV